MADLPKTVLVVEMDPFFAILARRALEVNSIQCRVAYSARAAAQLAKSGERFALALVAVRLPDANGLDLIDNLRLQYGENFPVLVVGTDDAPQFRRHAIESGASEYLVKPVGVIELRDAVARWMPKGDGGGESASAATAGK